MLHLLWQEQMEQLDQFLVQDIFLVEVVEQDTWVVEQHLMVVVEAKVQVEITLQHQLKFQQQVQLILVVEEVGDLLRVQVKQVDLV